MTHGDRLPQLEDRMFLTDGGLETELVFHDGRELPLFAAFTLLQDEEGTERLRAYFRRYAELARERGLGVVLETPTWRASPRWAGELGIDERRLDALNRRAVALLEEVRDEHPEAGPFVISGNVGPQDDGYRPAQLLSADEAQRYHAVQIGTFADTAADLVTAMTITYADEAVGIARAAREAGMPVVISLPSRPTGACRAGRRWATRSARSTPRRPPGPPTTCSTARTPRTSRPCSTPARRGRSASSPCARTRPR